MKILSQRIKELRIEKGYSQTKLGELLGVSQDNVSLWERDKASPSVETVVVLASLFNVSSDYLLGLTEY